MNKIISLKVVISNKQETLTYSLHGRLPSEHFNRIAILAGPGIGDNLIWTPAQEILSQQAENCDFCWISPHDMSSITPKTANTSFHTVPYVREEHVSKYYQRAIETATQLKAQAMIWVITPPKDIWDKLSIPENIYHVGTPYAHGLLPNIVSNTYSNERNHISFQAMGLMLPFIKHFNIPTPFHEFIHPRLLPSIFNTSSLKETKNYFNQIGIDIYSPYFYVNCISGNRVRALTKGLTVSIINMLQQKFPKTNILLNAGLNHGFENESNINQNQYSASVFRQLMDRKNVYLMPEIQSLQKWIHVLALASYVISPVTSISHILSSKELGSVPNTTIYPNQRNANSWSIPTPKRLEIFANQEGIIQESLDCGDSTLEVCNNIANHVSEHITK